MTYLAPEVLCGYEGEAWTEERSDVCPLSPKVDVWALGMLLLEQALVGVHAACWSKTTVVQ